MKNIHNSTLQTPSLNKLVKNQIAHQFDRASATYDRSAQLQNEMASHLIAMISKDRSGKLVDLGCGTGWALEQIGKLNTNGKKRFDLTAIDIAPGMIEVAQSRVPDANFHCSDLEQTPLGDSFADVVFSSAAIQWCDLSSAIKEMKRLCKPDGQIVFSTFGPATLREIRTAWKEAGDENERVHLFDSAEKIESALQETDSQPASIETREVLRKFSSVDQLLQSIKQIGATNAAATRQTGLLGKQLYREFRDVFERRLIQDGILTLTFECIFASVFPLNDLNQARF